MDSQALSFSSFARAKRLRWELSRRTESDSGHLTLPRNGDIYHYQYYSHFLCSKNIIRFAKKKITHFAAAHRATVSLLLPELCFFPRKL